MNRVAANEVRQGVASDGAFLLSISDLLEKARAEIEQRFLAGGAALVLAHENIQRLVQAFDKISHSLDEATASRTIGKLGEATSELHRRIDAEQDRQAELGAILQRRPTLLKDVEKIRAILGHLSACATATRITGAGNEKFVAFGHEISSYVRKAEEEVTHFSNQVELICEHLQGMDAEGKQSLEVLLTAVPKASEKLVEAAAAIDRRMSELRTLALGAAPLMRAVEVKFATMLTALQIGDVTRQRIEHVQACIRDLLSLPGGTESPGLRITALRLFDALTASLSCEFDSNTRQVIDALQGLGADALGIMALRATGAAAAPNDDAPLAVAKDNLDSMRRIVADVERASNLSANADETIRRLATDLLAHAGDIGNLSNVRRDIRLLALNAHLHCSRMGELGRAVSVIAAEINVAGDRLGGATEAVLHCMGEIRNRESRHDDKKSGVDLIGDLDGVAAALQAADFESRENLALVSSQGETIIARIFAAARDLDFSLRLGEQLAACSAALRNAIAEAGSAGAAPEQLKAFACIVSARYTMKTEREIHYKIFKDIITLQDPAHEPLVRIKNDDSQLDSCFL